MPKPRAHIVVERRALARILDVSVRHLADLEAEHVVVPLRRGRGGRASQYALEAVVPTYLAHLTSAPASGDEREARRRRDLAQAVLTELRIDRERGQLVSRDAVLLAGQHYTKAWAAKVRYLPHRLIQAGLITREQERPAANLCREILMEIASWKTLADIRRASRAPRKGRNK